MLNLFEGVLIGPDQKSTAIVLQLLLSREFSGMHVAKQSQRFAKLRQQQFLHAAVAGEAVQIQDMFNLVERDGNLLYIASLVVLSIMLLVIFRNVRWVLASVGIVIASVALYASDSGHLGRQLSMVSSMLNSLVTVISIGTTTHIIVYYRELRATYDQHAATVRTLRELWHPVMWTVITIAVGFAALLVSDIVPVRSFAIMMTLGTLTVLVVSIAVLPATFASGQVPIPGTCPYGRPLDRLLDRMAHAIDRHPVQHDDLVPGAHGCHCTRAVYHAGGNRLQQKLSRILTDRAVAEVRRVELWGPQVPGMWRSMCPIRSQMSFWTALVNSRSG